MDLAAAPKVIVLDAGGPGGRDSPGPLGPRDLDRFACQRVSWAHERSAGDLPSRGDVLIVALGDADEPSSRAVLDWLHARRPRLPVLAVLPTNLPQDLVRRAAILADDFVVSPVNRYELETRLLRLVPAQPDETRSLARRLARDLGLRNLVGEDPAFRRLVDGIPRVAANGATVLITGETGTGKELYARAVHHLGPRRDCPFVAVDCGAFPEQLLENELFGHARGAFTDARAEHKGLARMAEGGVLFLDEVDTLSAAAQGKLLRFLQERTFKPLGAERAREADVRVVAATNRDLGAEVKAHRFRADLFFRLSVLPVHIMPLRERRGDIALLARHFLDRCNQSTAPASGPKQFTDEALEILSAHGFPGNVRELHNVVQRATVMIEGQRITGADLRHMIGGGAGDAAGAAADADPRARPDGAAGSGFRSAKANAVAVFERAFVGELLRKHGGNITRASREARKDRRAFGRLVKKYHLAQASD